MEHAAPHPQGDISEVAPRSWKSEMDDLLELARETNETLNEEDERVAGSKRVTTILDECVCPICLEVT
eukprot:8567532-Pyramimonas_sp.AAC.1